MKKKDARPIVFVPNADLYVVDEVGAIRRKDILAAGGRHAHRESQRERRRRRLFELKTRGKA